MLITAKRMIVAGNPPAESAIVAKNYPLGLALSEATLTKALSQGITISSFVQLLPEEGKKTYKTKCVTQMAKDLKDLKDHNVESYRQEMLKETQDSATLAFSEARANMVILPLAILGTKILCGEATAGKESDAAHAQAALSYSYSVGLLVPTRPETKEFYQSSLKKQKEFLTQVMAAYP